MIILNKDIRYSMLHASEGIDLSIKYTQLNFPSKKPRGLWYSFGDAWVQFLNKKCNDVPEPNPLANPKLLPIYKIELYEDKILKINNIKDWRKFNYEYCASSTMVHWDKVAKKYCGIELCPYYPIEFEKESWYNTFEIESGCVWKMSAIKSIIKIN